MTERPILFSSAMVKAILAGTKTMTRGPVKPQPVEDPTFDGGYVLKTKRASTGVGCLQRGMYPETCPFGVPGDRLWVRETWKHYGNTWNASNTWALIAYRADDEHRECYVMDPPIRKRWTIWRPSIHMPKWASRITLEITDVRVQRLQEISEVDARAEGTIPVEPGAQICDFSTAVTMTPYRNGFRVLWGSINAKRGYGWSANPWVWAVSFKRAEATN